VFTITGGEKLDFHIGFSKNTGLASNDIAEKAALFEGFKVLDEQVSFLNAFS